MSPLQKGFEPAVNRFNMTFRRRFKYKNIESLKELFFTFK